MTVTILKNDADDDGNDFETNDTNDGGCCNYYFVVCDVHRLYF